MKNEKKGEQQKKRKQPREEEDGWPRWHRAEWKYNR